MMGLGDTIASMTGLSDGGGSNLKGFLSKFNSSEGKYADVIDPLNTFDVTMAFYPKLEPKADDTSTVGKLLNKIGSSLKSAAMSVGNNLTGGLLGSIMNDITGKSLDELKTNFVGGENFGKQTVFEYIAKGNMYVSDVDSQLIMDISYYVQNMTLPQLITPDGGTIDTLMGTFPTNGAFVKPSQNQFQMNVINTKAPLLERIFYPWMREVTLPYWSYDDQPYTTATITVDFAKHSDFKYVFVGCRPTNITTLEPSQELNGSPTRQVTMTFDYMFVNSECKAMDSTKDKLVGLGTSVVNDLGSAFGL